MNTLITATMSTLLNNPHFRLFAGAVMISFSAVFVKLADVSPTASGFYRVFFGALLLLAATLWPQKNTKQLPGHWCLLIVCGLLFAVDLFFWHECVLFVGPGLATILGNLQVFLLAAGILLPDYLQTNGW